MHIVTCTCADNQIMHMYLIFFHMVFFFFFLEAWWHKHQFMLLKAIHLLCFSAGDLRRANGLLARYGFLLHEGGSPSVRIYNLLMKVFHHMQTYGFLKSRSSFVSQFLASVIYICVWYFHKDETI